MLDINLIISLLREYQRDIEAQRPRKSRVINMSEVSFKPPEGFQKLHRYVFSLCDNDLLEFTNIIRMGQALQDMDLSRSKLYFLPDMKEVSLWKDYYLIPEKRSHCESILSYKPSLMIEYINKYLECLEKQKEYDQHARKNLVKLANQFSNGGYVIVKSNNMYHVSLIHNDEKEIDLDKVARSNSLHSAVDKLIREYRRMHPYFNI